MSSKYFIDLEKCPEIVQFEGLTTKVLTGLNNEKMMMVLTSTMPNCEAPMHKHPHEQIGMVYDGEAFLQIGDEVRHVKKGDFYCIPANVEHGDKTIGDKPFVMFDIFYPIRETFIEKLNS